MTVTLPPGPSNLQSKVDPLTLLDKLSKDYGDFARYQTAYGHTTVVNEPEAVREVLFNPERFPRSKVLSRVLGNGLLASEGQFWRLQRRRYQPRFHPGALESYALLMAAESLRFVEEWKDAAAANQRLELGEEMMKYALRVSSEILLGARVADEKSNRALCDAMNVVIAQLGLMGNTMTDTMSPEENRRQRVALGLLERILQHLIAQRAGQNGGHDLLGVMINLEDETGAPALTPAELRDEVATILLGGHETTSVALTWALWELGSRPDLVAELVSGEWKEVLDGSPPTWEQLPRLTQTRSVMQEILRLHPPVWSLVRDVPAACRIGPYELPAGEYVLISPYMAHRRKASWENPHQFRPDRFVEGTTKEQSRGRYIPFGAGPHTCVGQHFAMMELMITLPTLLQHFEVVLESSNEPRPIPLITLRAELPIHFRLRRRRR